MALSFVQAKYGGSLSLTFDTNVTAGNLIAGAIGWDDATNTLTGISDGANTYTLLDNPTTCTDIRAASFYAKNTAAGATTVTATFSGAPNNIAFAIHEILGADTVSPLDKHQIDCFTQGAGDPLPDLLVAGPVTTTADGEYIFGFAGNKFRSATPNSGTGFVARTGDPGGGSEDKIQTSAGSISVKFTPDTAVSERWSITIVTFQGAAAAAAGPVVPKNSFNYMRIQY